MFLRNWRSRFVLTANRSARRRCRKRSPRLQSLEPRTLLSVTPAGATITPAETSAFTGVVASFTANDAGPFTASINWGDGTTTSGTVAVNGSGFDVMGTHTYAEDGSQAVSVLISDAADSTTATAASTANVNEGPFTLTAGGTLSATEGHAVTGFPLATFNDPGSPNAAGDFNATVDWGDGTTTTGTITGSGGSFTITGSHTYADELSGAVDVTVAEPAANFTLGPIADSITVAEADMLTPGFITTGVVNENEFVGGTAALFHDAGYPSNAAADFTGTFDWGDGTTFSTSAGNAFITTDGAGNFTLSVTGHSYADEGAYTVVATLADDAPGTDSLSQTGTLTAIEADAFTLSPTHATITASEGATASGAVAIFSDTGYPNNSAGDFSATVDWGDGSTTPGSVATAGDGNFTVSGSHAYAEEGAYTITATIKDDLPGSVTASTTATADIAEADLTLTAAVPTFAATEGAAVSGIVATISDVGSTDPASAYSVTVDWGDGTTTTGSLAGAAGTYNVVGSHTYADEGKFTVTVTVAEPAATPTATATATLTANVADEDLLTGSAAVQATEGIAFNGAVARFTDSGYPGNVAGDFTANIDWGDGTTTAGSVSGSGGTFTVSGQHLYVSDLNYPLTVTLADDAPGTATATATGTAAVADNDTLVPGAPITLAATEGATISGVFATFTDPTYPSNVPDDFLASIAWGDGTTTAGTVGGSPGSFTVTGSHVYAEEGTKTATIVLADDTPNTSTGTATAIVNVADAALSATGATVASSEGFAFTGVVANFTDADPNAISTDYTATITWGDGSTSTAAVAANGSGGFRVTGTHTYAEEGTSPISVAIADVAGATATASSTAIVGDATLSASAVLVNATEGASFTGAVAGFTDADPNGTVADYNATIDWGDGSSSSGTIAADRSGGFNVTGTHTYLEEGTDFVHVVVQDAGGSEVLVISTAQVADAPLSATAVAVTSPEYSNFSGVVTTFTDADANGKVADYTATIDWGDGSSTAVGTVAAVSGGFHVSGSHTYAEDGTHTIAVNVVDAGGSIAASTGTATITEPSIAVSPVSFVGHELSPLGNVAVATFQHGNGAEPASGFTATIQWGDGTSSAGTVSESGTTYTVSGSHTYLDEGSFPLLVQIKDDAASATVVTSSRIFEELLPNGSVGTANERFIAEVYRDLLHRQVDATALPYWSNQLDQGQSRLQVAQAIINTAMRGELGADLVQGIYQKYLGRAPDATGLAFWVGILNGHETIEQTESNIVATPEFFAKAGGTNDGYITRLFELALGREPDATARANFDAALAGGMSREQVAEIVFGSHEYHQKTVAGYYQSPVDANDRFVATPFIDDLDFLDRPADPTGQAAFTTAMDHGLADQQAWADFLASDEFFAKVA